MLRRGQKCPRNRKTYVVQLHGILLCPCTVDRPTRTGKRSPKTSTWQTRLRMRRPSGKLTAKEKQLRWVHSINRSAYDIHVKKAEPPKAVEAAPSEHAAEPTATTDAESSSEQSDSDSSDDDDEDEEEERPVTKKAKPATPPPPPPPKVSAKKAKKSGKSKA